MSELELKVQALKHVIWDNHGRNAVTAGFSQEVDRLLSALYDDIGEIKSISLRALFDLFLIKTLYVDRGSRDAYVLDYLSNLLAGFLFARDLFPLAQNNQRRAFMLSDLLEEMQHQTHFQNLFEAYRKLGDYSLFIVGVFPASQKRRRRASRWYKTSAPVVDVGYHVSMGKQYYQWAASHELAEATAQRPVLGRLSQYFETYMEALNETSDRYILGFDMNLIADKMLDCFNQYRATGDLQYLENARKYAALLKVDRTSFPSLFRLRRPRPRLLGN